MNYLTTCRFCGTWEGSKVKYGLRHYAHPQCLLDKKGRDAILNLPAWKLRNLPWKFIKDNRLEDLVKAIITKAKAVKP